MEKAERSRSKVSSRALFSFLPSLSTDLDDGDWNRPPVGIVESCHSLLDSDDTCSSRLWCPYGRCCWRVGYGWVVGGFALLPNERSKRRSQDVGSQVRMFTIETREGGGSGRESEGGQTRCRGHCYTKRHRRREGCWSLRERREGGKGRNEKSSNLGRRRRKERELKVNEHPSSHNQTFPFYRSLPLSSLSSMASTRVQWLFDKFQAVVVFGCVFTAVSSRLPSPSFFWPDLNLYRSHLRASKLTIPSSSLSSRVRPCSE